MAVQDGFARALADLWARDGIVVEECDPAALAERVAASCAAGAEGPKLASELLTRSGVRRQWNDILRRDRAAALATRIRPHVTEPLLDVMAGDGSICRALADLGVTGLAATERPGDYADSVLPPHVRFRPFDDTLDLAQFEATTALLSTVLHHEPYPVRLLDALAATPIQRWIVVENCVLPEFSHAFHQFTDRFFNHCLNDFGVPCVNQHRTLDEWIGLLTAYGEVSVIDAAFAVPGIPFPYSLLVVTRQE